MRSLSTLLTIPPLLALTLTGALAKPLSNKELTKRSEARNTSLLIDELMVKGYEDFEVEPNAFIDDSTFLRRAYVTIIGRIPTAEEARAFYESYNSNKRHELIDELVDSPGFGHHMFNTYADMLRLRTSHYGAGIGWHIWLKDAVENNMPYNEMVYEMLAAEGHVTKNPAAAYYVRDLNMLLDNVSNTAQIFLGTQIGCAQCHDDPFQDTTQMDYFQLAAFSGETRYGGFSGRERIKELGTEYAEELGVTDLDSRSKANRKKMKNSSGPLKLVSNFKKGLGSVFGQFRRNEIASESGRTLKLPHDYQYNDGEPNQVVEPKTLFGTMPDIHAYDYPKQAFAAWVTSPDNPMFTKTIANRLWRKAFGYALAEPVDAWTPSTKVSHPEALAMVEDIMKATSYDVRETMRVLYHTALFQREVSVQEVEMGKRHDFAGPILRRLSGEELYDSYLTIESGNLDDRKNEELRENWSKYQERINFIMTADASEMVTMVNDHLEYDERRYESQAYLKNLKIELQKARANGDSKRSKQINEELKADAKKTKEYVASKEYLTDSMALANSVVRSGSPRQRLRSAELPAPFGGASMQRQFGSSDRETPDSGHSRANVPQILTLFNGQSILKISDTKGRLADLIKGAKTKQGKLEAIFLSIYSRPPTSLERVRLEKLMTNQTSIAMVVRAMLTSKQFLFLQ